MQMVGQNQLWVSQIGVAFDMQSPPPHACMYRGGGHFAWSPKSSKRRQDFSNQGMGHGAIKRRSG